MIPLEIFDYSKVTKIDMKVTKYVNANLASIVQVVIDYLNDNGGFDMDGFLPRDYLERKPDECRRLVDELHEMITSDSLRTYYIKPKYQYLLYTILSWWGDCVDDESDLLNLLDGELLKEIENEESYITEEDSNYVLSYITSYDSYDYICFSDYDFLPSQLTSMVSLYLVEPNLFKVYRPDVNLDNYLDLMPCDLRELYLENKQDINMVSEPIDMEQGVVFEFMSVLHDLEQRVVEIVKRDEVEISNDIYGHLNRILKVKYNLEATREMTIGRAKKKLGETDLYIYKSENNFKEEYAIAELKIMNNNFAKQYQQLLGYLNQNFRFGITISINNTLKLADALTYIQEELYKLKENFMLIKITSICIPHSEFPYLIKSTHIIPEDPAREMSIYHMILNLYDKERKEVAKKARQDVTKKSLRKLESLT